MRRVVREAWATGCQQKGVAVCRFILSEDEITPQVRHLLTSHMQAVPGCGARSWDVRRPCYTRPDSAQASEVGCGLSRAEQATGGS